MVVDTLKRRWKESKQRKRHWFSLKKAARLVEEEELSSLLKALTQRDDLRSIIKELRDVA